MSDPARTTQLDTCGCCEADAPQPRIHNRPGLPAISYRIGVYAAFLRRMLARLPGQTIPDGPHQGARPLLRLTTRAADDPAIALLDAWATVSDVLTFYQERIANEGYLRTATERRSILELARMIGYELNPGVAASAFLAFTVEDAAGAPGVSVVPQGTKIQSIPGQGQLPQTFETSAEITSRAEWNALRPRLTQPQTLSLDAESLYFAGVSANLKQGDWLLMVVKPSGSSPPETRARRIQRVEADHKLNRTRVDFSTQPAPLPPFQPVINLPGVITLAPTAFVQNQVFAQVTNRSWSESNLNAYFTIQGWSPSRTVRHIATPPAPTLPPADEGVFRFRERLGFFGHNAPPFRNLPSATTWTDWDDDTPPTIWQTSTGVDYSTTGADVYLERSVPEIVRGGWALFERPGADPASYRVDAVSESSLSDFAISAKAMGLRLAGVDGTSAPNEDVNFKVRITTAYVNSERLELAELPIEQPIAKDETTIHLDRMTLGLSVDQPVIVSGERDDLPGVIANEVELLEEITHSGGFTSLEFQEPLRFSYKRDTVTINANIARATHGETVKEVLGGGDGASANQRFTLKKPPLTYVSAATSSGAASTLEVRVNNILWLQSPQLFGLDERSESYIVRVEDDGKTGVIFGDGAQGARLPTGTENVTAVYRSGIGLAGMVGADKLTLLQTRPLGIRGVTNPLAPAGAAEPENRDGARANAPLTVLTLERIVSLQDFEDFTRAFAGIGKAQAVALWRDQTRWAHLTIAAEAAATDDDGDALSAFATHIVDDESNLFINLVEAVEQAGDPGQRFRVDTYTPVFFNLKAKVKVNPRHVTATVLAAVETALQAAFAFEPRAFGQAATAAEVVTVMQGVPGVIAIDLDRLFRVDIPTPDFSDVLFAERVRWPQNQQNPLPAELLLINPAGVTLEEMTQ